MIDSPSNPLWIPSPERIASTRLAEFAAAVVGPGVSSDELWNHSIEQPGEFWAEVWDHCGVLGERGERPMEEGERFRDTRFLPDATVNFAENLLAERPGAGQNAILAVREDGRSESIGWEDLRGRVAAAARFLTDQGVSSGDRVAAWMPHLPETVIMFLAASSIGAVFTSTSADFGVSGVVDRFGQTEPVVLIAADGYQYGGKSFDCLDRLAEIERALPTVTSVVVVGNLADRPDVSGLANPTLWSEIMEAGIGAELSFESLPFDHPIYVLYSSGTTGKPKCIVHRAGGVLLKHLAEQQLQCDIRPGDNVFYFTTCGWMMWNWLVSALATGATIVLFDGSPVHPGPELLFDLVDKYELSLLGVSAKFIDSSMKAGLRPTDSHDLGSLRAICSTGSPLVHEGFAWIYQAVKPDVHLASIAGGTDLCGCLVAGDPTKPVYAGAIQRPTFGLDIGVLNPDGTPADPGVKGELVCRNPFPSMPLEFWGDPDGARYQAAYFDKFEGIWTHGDFASWTPEGGIVIHGRSDATLNASGIRIGTAEIYRVVEAFAEVAEAIAVGQEWDNDTRIVLFVRLAEGAILDDGLAASIRSELRQRCSPRHVPAVIRSVADIPRTRSGKIVELAVTDVIHGRPVANSEALANPEALDLFAASLEN